MNPDPESTPQGSEQPKCTCIPSGDGGLPLYSPNCKVHNPVDLPNPSADEEVERLAAKWVDLHSIPADAQWRAKLAIRDAIHEATQQHNADREEVQAFIKHVGFPTFKECVDVMLRTKAQDEDKIEGMFNKLKEQGKELQQLRASLAEKEEALQEVSRSKVAGDQLNAKYIEEIEELKAEVKRAWRVAGQYRSQLAGD